MNIYATNPGPIDDSVLCDQDKHVSSAVWEGQERGALRCHEHTSKLDQWILTSTQVELVQKAGFGYLRLIPAISLDNPLISALVERWRRETNTFHFTVGEMTITLEDVAYLLGLAINGDPVIGVTYTTCEAVCLKFLGKAPESGYTSGGMVKLSWLKEAFSLCPEDAPIEEIERHTRAYLLYLVGSTIFSTTTGNKVPVMYLPLFENFDQAGKYAWGAAALSFLYRALGNASLKSQSTISGCLTMLQCWSYHHLNVGRPKLNRDPVHDCFPFVLGWKVKQSGPTQNRDVAFYRKAFDALKPCDVEWCPYANIDHNVIPEDIKNNLILGRSKTMLICFDKAERHLPDRCLRQYGIQQSIPEDVPRWERKSRGVDGGVDLSGKMELELKEWSDRFHQIVEGDEDVDESEYMQWYLRITRKLVGRPIPISSEFQRMNAALRDIAHLADTLSIQGMDEQQVHAVTRIRYIVHECLRDQGGSLAIVEADSQNELGKRVRGKERVRRKGTGKRKRRDDLEQCSLVGEDAQSQLCIVAVELDDVEVDHSRLCHVDGELEHSQLCLPTTNGEDTQLCHPSSMVDESQLCHVAGEVDDSHFRHTADEVDHNQLSHAGNECDSQPAHVAIEVDPQPADVAIEVVPQPSLDSSNEATQQNDYSVLV